MTDPDGFDWAHGQLASLEAELGKCIVGHEGLIKGILAALLAGGHVLLEGVPGLGKTLLVRSLGNALDLEFSRIQFTPDLMPADIIGTQMVMLDEDGQRYFEFQPGPLFTQLLLADEINRATPKTQSALLEAMEEHRVTVGRTGHPLREPFMVLATQNPIEMEGTYPLPEAQLDRFLLKLHADYPDANALAEIVDRATAVAEPDVRAVMSAEDLAELRRQARSVVIAAHVKGFAINVVLATHPDKARAIPSIQRYVRYGASPRGLLSLIKIAKAFALFEGRLNVSFDDLKSAAAPALRHRILLNFEGEAEGIAVDDLVDEILRETPVVA